MYCHWEHSQNNYFSFDFFYIYHLKRGKNMENEVKEVKSDYSSSSFKSNVFTRWSGLCKRSKEEENSKTTISFYNGIEEENIQKGSKHQRQGEIG